MTLSPRAPRRLSLVAAAIAVLVVAWTTAGTASAGTARVSGPGASSSATATGDTTLTLPRNAPAAGTRLQLTAQLQLSGTGASVAGQWVTLWVTFSPTDNRDFRYAMTDASGQAVFDVPSSTIPMTYFARFDGEAGLSPQDSAYLVLPPATTTSLVVSLAASAVPRWGQVVVRARLTAQTGGTSSPLVGQPVRLRRDGDGLSAAGVTGVTDSDGVATYTETVIGQTGFYAIYSGDSTLAPVSSGTATVTTYDFLSTGSIGVKYRALGGAAGLLGEPTSNEYDVRGGRAQDFAGGRVYWSPAFGAFEVHGAILERYVVLSGPAGFLGMPVSDETAGPPSGGKASHFSGGAVFWSPTSGPWSVHGDILRKYESGGAPRYAYPITDELTAPDGVGRYNHFTGGASIYWTPSTGSHFVLGAIREHWAATGWERNLGYPLTDEVGSGTGRMSEFRNGTVYWSAGTGAWFVRGALRDRFRQLGGPQGELGFPVSDEFAVPGGMRSNFQKGALLWNARTGAITRL